MHHIACSQYTIITSILEPTSGSAMLTGPCRLPVVGSFIAACCREAGSVAAPDVSPSDAPHGKAGAVCALTMVLMAGLTGKKGRLKVSSTDQSGLVSLRAQSMVRAGRNVSAEIVLRPLWVHKPCVKRCELHTDQWTISQRERDYNALASQQV